MAVLNEDENTGNKQTATKINAPVERMPAMFKQRTIGRKYDSCNTDEFWRVSRCFFRGGVFWQISYFLSSKLIFIKITIYEITVFLII